MEKMIQKNKNPGFTLIEVLIAMAIFAIGFLALATIQIKSISQNATARMYSDATTMAVEAVERLMALPYDHPDLNQSGNPHIIEDRVHKIEWNVQNNKPVAAAKTIVVSVSGANPHAIPLNIRFIKGQRF